MLKNKCCLYVIISIRFFSITICNLLVEFPSYVEETNNYTITSLFYYTRMIYIMNHTNNVTFYKNNKDVSDRRHVCDY